MIILNSSTLPKDLTEHLASKQLLIDTITGFDKKAKKAITLWKRKSSTNDSKLKFEKIRALLYKLCISEGICNYCENNESIDIEHIYPKSFHPEKCFIWLNYLLACKKCNMHHKSAKFAIFDPTGNVIKLKSPKGKAVIKKKPPKGKAVMINPRIENAMDYLTLDIKGKTFLFVPISNNKNSKKYKKANYTLELLSLNERDALVAARKKQGKNYVSDLQRYVKIKLASNKEEILQICDPLIADDLDLKKSLELLKSEIMAAIEKDIKTSSHPTVWKELIRQRKNLNRTNKLFKQAPEALNW